MVASDANQQGASPASGYQLPRKVGTLADKSKGSFLERERGSEEGGREGGRERGREGGFEVFW